MKEPMDFCNCRVQGDIDIARCGLPATRFFIWQTAGSTRIIVFGRCDNRDHHQHVECEEITRNEALTLEVMES